MDSVPERPKKLALGWRILGAVCLVIHIAWYLAYPNVRVAQGDQSSEGAAFEHVFLFPVFVLGGILGVVLAFLPRRGLAVAFGIFFFLFLLQSACFLLG